MSRYTVTRIAMVVCAIALASCGSSDVKQNMSAEDRFEQGKKKFTNGDYLEAISDFEIVKLQFPGSTVSDDAQFYLGECHYHQEEYLLAAEEYQALKRNMPASPFVPQAQFKVAMCYYNLSPPSVLDQAYTARAIDEFQAFIEYNPTNELVPDGESKIKELTTRLARKLFETAELYVKMEYYRAATIYYNSVVEKYHDTPYAEPALLGKAKTLVARKKFDEAKQEIDKFLQKYPDSPRKGEAKSLHDEIEEHLNLKPSSIGSSLH